MALPPTFLGKTALQWFTFAVSTAYQIAQHNKMKREADKRKGFAINTRGEATHIPIVYGKQAVGFIEANHKTLNSFTYSAPNSGGTEWHSKNSFLNQNRGAGKNSLLIMDGAICQGGIEGVQGIEVDARQYNKDKKHRHVFHTYNTQLASTSSLGSSNGLGDNHFFTGLSHSTAAFLLNRDDYNYNGIPNVTFFVKGRKVRPVINSGGSYSLGAYIYSNNPSWCLLDYLLGDHGRNINVSDVDLESFYNAGTICNTTVMNNVTVAGSVNGEYPIEAYNTLNDFPDVTSDDTSEETYYKAVDTGNFYTFTQTGTEEEPNGSYSSATLGTRSIPLYECNISLDSEQTVRDNIEAILNTMPLSVLTWTSDGKYKLQLEYPSDQTELEALTVKTFNNDNIIRDSIDLQWAAASERYNSVTVTFLNEHENFKEDSKTWPDKETAAGRALSATLLSQDNNQPMSTDINLTGITDPYHALAHAEQIGRQSRTFHTLSFVATKEAIGLEPGDFIKVELPLSDIDAVYRVNSTEISEDLTVKIDAFYIDINGYAWNVSDNDLPGVTETNPTNFDPDLITNLSWSTTALYNGVASGSLSWTAADSDVLYYIVQASNDNQTTWFDLGTTTGSVFDVTALAQGSYHWAVRTVAPNGQVSGRVVIGPYSLLYTGPRTQDYIYGTTANQDTNTQSYNDTLSETSYPYVAVIDYKPDEQPTLPVRSSSGITLNFLSRTATLVRELSVYQRSLSTPSAPSGGSYNFSTNTLTPPSGWYNSVPIGVGPVWISNSQAEGLSATTNATPASWSSPAILGQDGEDAGVLIVYADDASGTNKTTTYSNQEYVLYYEYAGTAPSVSTVTGTWVKFVGDDGTSGQGIWPIYATNASGSSQSFTIGSREYVTFYESISQPTLPVSGQTFVKFIGDDGVTGDDAPRLTTVRVYRGATSQPSAPSATITWSNLAVSGLTSGWSLTAPTIDASSTTTFYFSDISFTDPTGTASSTDATGTTPTRSVNFDGIVSFTNLNTRLADATTVIDGDRITTGTIDATQVNVTNIRADSISVGTGTINTGVIPTLNQSKISGLTTDLSNVNTVASNAQSTADTAVNDASTAQSTANTAQSTADTAQSTANTAESTANTAQSTANTAQSTANTANSTANTAYTTAIGKIKSYYQSSTPSASAVGDIWFNTSQQKNYYWTGSSWQPVALTADSIAANYVYAGSVNASQINAGTINADRIPTMATNQFTTMSGLYGNRSGDTDDPAATGIITTLYYTPSSSSKVLLSFYADVTFEQRGGGEGSYAFATDVYLNNSLVIVMGGGASTDGPVSAKLQGFHSFNSSATQQTIQVRWRQFRGRKGRMQIHSGFVAGLFTQT
jgi:hypothetical protein